jgi:hypothetical protein
MAKSSFQKMCNPAKLYLAVSVVGIVYGLIQKFSLITLGTNFIFVILWTMVLNWLCSIGLKTVSWILVLLPYLMLFLSAGFIVDMMKGGKKDGFQMKQETEADKIKRFSKLTSAEVKLLKGDDALDYARLLKDKKIMPPTM